MKKRTFLTGASSVALAGLTGCTQSTATQPKFHIYRNDTIGRRSLYSCKQILTRFLPAVLDTIGVMFDYDVVVHPDVIEFNGDTSREKLNALRSQTDGYISQNIHIGLDAGIEKAPLGNATVPKFSVQANRHATVHVADELKNVNIAGLSSDMTIEPNKPPVRSVRILLHEIGHTLGLLHKHGTARERSSGRNVHSLMANRDLLYSGKNHFNTSLPEPDNEQLALQELSFNDKLRKKHIKI